MSLSLYLFFESDLTNSQIGANWSNCETSGLSTLEVYLLFEVCEWTEIGGAVGTGTLIVSEKETNGAKASEASQTMFGFIDHFRVQT